MQQTFTKEGQEQVWLIGERDTMGIGQEIKS